MLRLIALRLLAAVPVLLVVSLVSFGLTLLVPGDIAAEMAGPTASATDIQRLRVELGLDQPPLARMAAWYGGLLHGDLGRSVLLQQGVGQAIGERLPVTLSLTTASLALACLLGVPAGLLAAAKARRWPDQAAMGAALVGLSVPDFWLGLLLIWIVGVKLGWLPTGGFVAPAADPLGWLRSIALPAATLALTQLGPIARMTRSASLEIAGSDFIRTARAKGLTEPRVYAIHVLAGALVPILTVVGIGFGLSLGGALVIEQVFSLPGVGRLVIGAVLRRDWPIIQGGLLIISLVFVVVNLLVDVLYLLVDPRLRDAGVKDLFGRRAFLLGLFLLGVVVAAAVLAGWIAPFDPVKSNFRNRLGAPSALNLFGTDRFGRDVFSRILFGARISLRIGLAVAAISGLAGAAAGLAAGWSRGIDRWLMRVMDGLMAFPGLLLAIALSATLGPSETTVIAALAVSYTPRTARVMRGAVLVARAQDYVEAARAVGARTPRLLARHILPACAAPLVVQQTYVFAIAILAEAVLSFVGVGPPPPQPTLGSIIADGRDAMVEAPWVCLAPGVAIALLVLGLNLLGDGLRDALDPRMRRMLR